MRDDQWSDLVQMIHGGLSAPRVGFIVDSPWIPGWCGMSIREYLCCDEKWLEANRRVVEEFPEVWFLPGFWAEFGMCTEPSAFGGRCRFPRDEFPHIEPILRSWDEVDNLEPPECGRDGLLPFVVERLKSMESRIERLGHRIRFAVTRGPLNIASYLLGQSEFLLGLKCEPASAQRLLGMITQFIKSWICYQKELFPSIDGILVLDDLIGFIGHNDFVTYALPYLKDIFSCLDVRVKMLHNDAYGLITARYLAAMGVNVFNFSYNHPLGEIRHLAGEDVVLMGNINPRDVLAAGSVAELREEIRRAWQELDDRRRVLWSAGGGMPPGVTSEKIRAFVAEVGHLAAMALQENASSRSLA